MEEIRIFKFILLLPGSSPCRLVVQSRGPVWSCLPGSTRYKTRGSFSLPAGNWNKGQYLYSFSEPLHVPLPVGCCRVKVVLRNTLRTVATFKASLWETCCPSSSGSLGKLYYQVGPIEGGGDPVNVMVVEGEDHTAMKCDDTSLTGGSTICEDNVIGAGAEYQHIQNYDIVDQEETLHDQGTSTADRNTYDSVSTPDDFTSQTEDLSGEIDEILSFEDTKNAVLTEDVLSKLAERMYETGCLAPQDELSVLYDQFIVFLVVVTVASVILHKWVIYIFYGTVQEEDEPLIDL